MKKVAAWISAFFIVGGIMCYVFGDPSIPKMKAVLSIFLVAYGIALWLGRNW